LRSPAGGEIGEAPPVADEASRFRGSAPIGGYDSARQSVGTTVGKRAPPLRTTRNAPSRADRVVRPYKIMPCRAGPMCPAVPPYPLQKARHCETSAHIGRGNPSSLPPGDRKGRPYAPSFRFQLFSFSSSPRKNPPEASASGGNSCAQFQFFLKTPRRRSAPPGTAPAPRAHTHTGPRCTTGRPGSCGCRC